MRAPWAAFLVEPLPGDHLVQLYRDERGLADAVALFAGAGIRKGDAVILVATPPHVAAIARALESAGLDVEQLRGWGQLTVVDAATLLARFSVGGRLDARAFETIVGAQLAAARASVPGRGVRVYGEMVDLLWKERLEDAVRLEDLWNGLIASHPISLLCAYGVGDAPSATFPAALCQAHRTLVPAEAWA